MKTKKTVVVMAATVLAAGITGFVSTGSAQAAPAPDDPPVYADVKAPTSIASDQVDGTDGAAFTPLLRNTIEDDVEAVTLEARVMSGDEAAPRTFAIRTAYSHVNPYDS